MLMCRSFYFKIMQIPFLLIAVLLASHLVSAAQAYRPVTLERLPLVGVNAILQDREGYVWYAMTEGGICRDNGYQVDIFRNDKTNTHRLGHSNGVLSICETANGDICLGTRENIYLLRKSDYSVIPLDTTIRRGKVRHIFNGKNGDIIAQTGSGWCRFDKHGKRMANVTEAQILRDITPSDTVPHNNLNDRLGHSWRISNSEPAIEPDNNHAIRMLPPSPYDTGKMKRCQDGKGFTYQGDTDGITITVTSSGKHVARLDGLSNIRHAIPRPDGGIYFISAHDALATCTPNGVVTSLVKGGESKTLAVAADGSVWVGGWHGEIWRYDNSRKRLILDNIASISDSDPVEGIAADKHNRLWIVTDKSIKVYDITNRSYRFITTRNPSAAVKQFLAIEASGDNIIAYGKTANLSIRATSDTSLPRPAITMTNIITDGRNTPLPPHTTEVSVTPETESVELLFSTFDHLNATDLVMSYRINNGEWHDLPAGDNRISFQQPHKGKYTIEVRFTGSACQRGGTRTFVLHRMPAWWETWWAYIIYVLLGISVAISIDRIYISYRATRRRLRELQAKLDEFMHDRTQTVKQLPSSIATNDADQAFIEKAMTMVEGHISDEDYDVAAFAKDLCMSRATLYRMFSSTTGQKPLEFIRTIRLKKAEEMLCKNPDMTIESVAARTGFASVSNFSRRFKEMFGITPSEARANVI